MNLTYILILIKFKFNFSHIRPYYYYCNPELLDKKNVVLVSLNGDYCMVTHLARVWLNRERLPILLVVS